MKRHRASNARYLAVVSGRTARERKTKPGPKPKPTPPVIDRALIAEAFADADTIPTPTGVCHDCPRPVTGERIYCGPCAARRQAL